MRPRRAFAVVGVAIVALFFWALWYCWFAMDNPALNWVRWLLTGALVYYPLHALVINPLSWNRTYRIHKALSRETRLEFSRDGIDVEQSGGRATLHWNDVHKWKEGPSLFLVYLSQRMFHIVPKRAFESADRIEEFRTLLLENIGRETA